MRAWDYITLVKIGTEGHDLAMLRGARELFAGAAHAGMRVAFWFPDHMANMGSLPVTWDSRRFDAS